MLYGPEYESGKIGSLTRDEIESEPLRCGRAPVFYHPVIGEPAGRYSNTRSLAFVLSGHTACVFIERESGCVALDALEAL